MPDPLKTPEEEPLCETCGKSEEADCPCGANEGLHTEHECDTADVHPFRARPSKEASCETCQDTGEVFIREDDTGPCPDCRPVEEAEGEWRRVSVVNEGQPDECGRWEGPLSRDWYVPVALEQAIASRAAARTDFDGDRSLVSVDYEHCTNALHRETVAQARTEAVAEWREAVREFLDVVKAGQWPSDGSPLRRLRALLEDSQEEANG